MITSSSNSRVKQVIQWQKSAKERNQAGVFPAEGFKMFEEVPEESLREVYLSQGAYEKREFFPALWEKLERTGYELVADDILARMCDTRTPQGILFVAGQPRYKPEQLLDVPNPLLVVLEKLQDPGNLGTIIRTGEGAGITGVIMDRQTVDLFNPKTIRATMGSVFRVPFFYTDNLQEMVAHLHERGIRTYAAHLEGKRYYESFSFCGGTAFLIGNEGNGLSRELTELAEEAVKIPMEGRVESLNAAVAASLLMYEAHRQRKTGSISKADYSA
ncbi:MAG: RNA methyltransferase [Butyrivibrio sp.]|nr:RNA methyltransferase [Acetatifactor muris]MCM1558947.1 RNA methyltransferase [Butyrivibrio sp.]